jgi:peroxiredoxin
MTLLRDRREEFEEAGVRPYGISRDSPWSHVAWAQALDLDVPLLSDWNGEAVRAFDIATEYRGLRDMAGRSAFLVDREGIIRGAWRYEPRQLPDFDELLSAARSLSSRSST